MESLVGYPVGRSVYATGEEELLLFGPYLGLAKGHYVVTVYGATLKSEFRFEGVHCLAKG
jgi:hypothetical protein